MIVQVIVLLPRMLDKLSFVQLRPAGYRSGVTYAGKKVWYACGLSGVDISKDDGVNFQNISTTSFHAVKKARKGKAVFFSGGGGRIGRLVD